MCHRCLQQVLHQQWPLDRICISLVKFVQHAKPRPLLTAAVAMGAASSTAARPAGHLGEPVLWGFFACEHEAALQRKRKQAVLQRTWDRH